MISIQFMKQQSTRLFKNFARALSCSPYLFTVNILVTDVPCWGFSQDDVEGDISISPKISSSWYDDGRERVSRNWSSPAVLVFVFLFTPDASLPVYLLPRCLIADSWLKCDQLANAVRCLFLWRSVRQLFQHSTKGTNVVLIPWALNRMMTVRPQE